MTATGAVLSLAAVLLGFALLIILVSYLSTRFQRWQDWRFARPVKRRKWGPLANLALVWHYVAKRK
jgi:hypothetical protein